MLDKVFEPALKNFIDTQKNDFLVYVTSYELLAILCLAPFVYFTLHGIEVRLDKARKAFKDSRDRATFISTFAFISASLVIAYFLIDRIKLDEVPVPDVVDQPQVVSELTSSLNWKRAAPRQGNTALYEVEISSNDQFSKSDARSIRTSDNVAPIMCSNCSFYWRVRTIFRHDRTGLYRNGPWSEPRRVDNYSDSTSRIRATRVMRVLVDYSYGRNFLRYLRTADVTDPKTGAKFQITYHAGYEPSLAYRIADKLCEALFEGKPEDAAPPAKAGAAPRAYTCQPSLDKTFMAFALPTATAPQASPDQPESTVPVRIFVEFIPLKRPDMYQRFRTGDYDLSLSNISYVESRITKYGISYSNHIYYESRHAALFYDASFAPGTAPGCQEGAFDTSEIASPRKVITVEDTTSDMCLKLAQRNGKSFEVVYWTLSSDGVDLISDTDAAGTLITDECFAEGILKHQAADKSRPHQPRRLRCSILPDTFFGDRAPHYCHMQQYRAVMRPNQPYLKAIVDNLFERIEKRAWSGKEQRRNWRLIQALEEKRFDGYLAGALRPAVAK